MRRRYNLRFILLCIIFLSYIFLVFFGIYHHEPWRDEAHAWMVAREFSPATIIDNIQNEGVPSLWYFLLMPFARLGFPYGTMGIVHGLFAVTAIWLLLFKSKLPFILKALIPFSYFVAYEYAVVARNYVFTGLLLYTVAVLYPKRFEKPLLYALPVGLLFHTNLHSVGFAAALTVLYLWELLRHKPLKPKAVAAFVLILALGVFSVITLLRGPMVQTVGPLFSFNVNVFRDAIRSAVVPQFPFFTPGLLLSFPSFTFISALTYVIAVSIAAMFLFDKQLLFLPLFMYGWLFYINVFVHPAELRHRGLFTLVTVFLFFMTQHIKSLSRIYLGIRSLAVITFAVSLGLSLLYTKYIFREDYLSAFSGAKDMATFIKTNSLESRTIVSFYSAQAEAVLPYFAHKPFYITEYRRVGYFNVADQVYTYIIYNNKVTMWDAIVKAKETGPDGKYPLLLLSEGMPPSEQAKFTKLHDVFPPYFWENFTENFWLWEYKGSDDV